MALDTIKAKSWQLTATHFFGTAINYRNLDYTQPTAITLGAVMHDMSDEALAAMEHHVVTSMMLMTQPFNVSIVAAIILFDAQQQRQANYNNTEY